MNPTTLLKKRSEMERRPSPGCHGGRGVLDWTIVLTGREHPSQKIRVHDDVLAPGVSIGEHPAAKEEHYYVLSGEGTVVLDGRRHPIGPGDVAVVFPGGTHGLENTGALGLRILVLIEC
jgi:mannose-6-phosphate isomerase-like protein (cupin superfamily)